MCKWQQGEIYMHLISRLRRNFVFSTKQGWENTPSQRRKRELKLQCYRRQYKSGYAWETMKFNFLIPHRHQLRAMLPWLLSDILTRAELPWAESSYSFSEWFLECYLHWVFFLKDSHEGMYATLVTQAHGNFLKPAFSNIPILTSLCSVLNVSLGIF